MNSNLAYKEEPREEVINGELVAMSPSPGWNHVSAAIKIFRVFDRYLEGKMCTVIPDGFDVHLTEKDIFQPDMMVVCDRSKIKRNGVYGAPDLVVEILSPSTSGRDRGYKKKIYGQCGVREYWLVSPSEKSVEVYRNTGTELVIHNVYTLYPDWALRQMSEAQRAAVTTHFQCSLFDGLNISLDDIFEDLLP